MKRDSVTKTTKTLNNNNKSERREKTSLVHYSRYLQGEVGLPGTMCYRRLHAGNRFVGNVREHTVDGKHYFQT